MGTNSNLKSLMELIEGHVGIRVVLAVALTILPVVVFRAPLPIIAPCVQPNKQLGEENPALACWGCSCQREVE